MSTILHIVERDEDGELLNNFIIDVNNITSMKASFVNKKEEEEEDGFETTVNLFKADYDSLEIKIKEDLDEKFGENPTLYRIAHDEMMWIETTDLKEFMNAYLETLSPAFIKDDPAKEDETKEPPVSELRQGENEGSK